MTPWRLAAHELQSGASALTADLVALPHEAIYWETSPSRTGDEAFEWVARDAPSLAGIQPEPDPFPRELGGPGASVLTFPNLSGDAWLVVPRPEAAPGVYPHLLTFLRGAPPSQVRELWRCVGVGIERWWSTRNAPVWVSTSGLGVSWLHVRLDERPKYYGHAPFRRPP